jgi:hypothetical protein
MSPVHAGLVYLPGTMVMFVASGATAGMHGRVSPRTLVVSGLVLIAAGMFASVAAGASSSWLAIEPGMVVACVGAGIFNPALSELVLTTVPEGQSALATGVNDTFRQAGVALGIAGLGALISGDRAGYVSGFHTALCVCGVVAAAGAVASRMLLPLRQAAVSSASPASAVPVEVG